MVAVILAKLEVDFSVDGVCVVDGRVVSASVVVDAAVEGSDVMEVVPSGVEDVS